MKDEGKRLKDEPASVPTADEAFAREFAEAACWRAQDVRQAAKRLAGAAAEAQFRVDASDGIAGDAEGIARTSPAAARELIDSWGDRKYGRGWIEGCILEGVVGDRDADLDDDVDLAVYESAATGAWADAELVAAHFRAEFPAPDSESVDAGTLADVRTLGNLLEAARKIVDRRIRANAAAAGKAVGA
jgi:hypothetical protein